MVGIEAESGPALVRGVLISDSPQRLPHPILCIVQIALRLQDLVHWSELTLRRGTLGVVLEGLEEVSETQGEEPV